jgi:hypothetical protein
MDDSQALPSRIASLRRRLDEAMKWQARGHQVDGAAISSKWETSAEAEEPATVTAAGSVEMGRTANDSSTPAIAPPVRPSSDRVQSSLARARDLLARLRTLSDDPLLRLSDEDPLNRSFQECTAMVHLALRTVQAFGASIGCQRELCEGLEAILKVVHERMLMIARVLEQRQAWKQRSQNGTVSHIDLARNAFAGVKAYFTRGLQAN